MRKQVMRPGHQHVATRGWRGRDEVDHTLHSTEVWFAEWVLINVEPAVLGATQRATLIHTAPPELVVEHPWSPQQQSVHRDDEVVGAP
jgi:hypothetical protein